VKRRHVRLSLDDLLGLATQVAWQLAWTERSPGPRKYRTKRWWRQRQAEWSAIGRGLSLRSGIVSMDRTHEPYARMYISAQEHPKFRQVGVHGWAFFWASVNYSRRNLTDGFVPMHQFLTFFDDVSPAQAKKVGVRLVKAHLLEPRKDGYRIHDWADHQNTKAEVEAASRVGRDNVIRGRWSKRKATDANTDGIASDTKPITHSLSPSRSPSLSVTSLHDQQRGANRSVHEAAREWARERDEGEQQENGGGRTR
jgi:hypothetical protein